MCITSSEVMSMYHEYEYYANEVVSGEKTKEALDDIKRNDRGYHKFKKVFNKEWKNKFYKTISVEVYVSGDTGSHIRDAITGRYSVHEVGSKEEDLYFKVSIPYTIAGPSQGSLFYSSPEEYENHQFVDLPTTIKQKWHQKNLIARKSME